MRDFAIVIALATASPAPTCREVVRDTSSRIVQTVDRYKGAGSTVQAIVAFIFHPYRKVWMLPPCARDGLLENARE